MSLRGALLALALWAPALTAQERCPQAAGADAEAGWEAYRAGDMELARARFAAALALCPGDPYASTGMGYVALRQGGREEARAAFATVLTVRPDDVDALVGMGILAWWDGDPAGAAARFRSVLRVDAANPTAREYLVRIEAAAALAPPPEEAVLASPPGVEEKVGLGGVLVLAGDTRGAEAAFREALAADAGSRTALVGLGRALTWGGRLVEGEEVLRRGRAAHPGDVELLVALAQNLRWQGRLAAAREVLEEAAVADPENGDVREQRLWVDAFLAPRLRPGFAAEWDSEDNRMVTMSVAAAARPVPRLTLRADAYRRSLELGFLSRVARGASVSAAWEAEPGWSLSAGAGGSTSDAAGSRSVASWSLAVASPPRHALSVAVAASSAAFDVTAPVADRGVRLTQAEAAARWVPAPLWRLDASAGIASFDGSQGNRRSSGALAASRRVARAWTVGAGVRALAFEEDLDDGYFDPDFLGMAEVSARWMHEPGPWSFVAEVAPALQQVGRDGDPAGAVRASGRVSFRFAPGREVVLSAGFSSTGLQSSSTGAPGYRYRAVGVGGSWVF